MLQRSGEDRITERIISDKPVANGLQCTTVSSLCKPPVVVLILAVQSVCLGTTGILTMQGPVCYHSSQPMIALI